MSTPSIHNLGSYLESVVQIALQGTGSTTNTTIDNLSSTNPFLIGQPVDNSQLSPVAEMLNALQQLQQSDPSKYTQVTDQIANNLQTAAQAAQAQGNTGVASRLHQLAADFSTAAKSAQPLNAQDVARAMDGRRHHHRHSEAASGSSSDGSSGGSSSGSNASSPSTSSTQLLGQVLAAFTTNNLQAESLNPTSIILSTMAKAGVRTPTY